MALITGIDQVVYGVEDIEACTRFFMDWGLELAHSASDLRVLRAANRSEVVLRRVEDAALPPAIEAGSTVRQVVWGVRDAPALAEIAKRLEGYGEITAPADGFIAGRDPNGLGLGFRVSRCVDPKATGCPTNTVDRAYRYDRPAPVYDRARPVHLAHIVFFTDNLEAMVRYYTEVLGFIVSDRYPGRGAFLRCVEEGTHHSLFVLEVPGKPMGLNHLSFGVRDIYEVFGGGLHFSRCGWEAEMGPGRHPVSSAIFWYFKCPAGGMVEYYADEDYCGADWQARSLEPSPELFAEWAVEGGIDGNTRRQKR